MDEQPIDEQKVYNPWKDPKYWQVMGLIVLIQVVGWTVAVNVWPPPHPWW